MDIQRQGDAAQEFNFVVVGGIQTAISVAMNPLPPMSRLVYNTDDESTTSANFSDTVTTQERMSNVHQMHRCTKGVR